MYLHDGKYNFQQKKFDNVYFYYNDANRHKGIYIKIFWM